eukprot:COSAG01_NODE_15977_length_1281_cov_1.312183_1_plen_358_part_00
MHGSRLQALASAMEEPRVVGTPAAPLAPQKGSAVAADAAAGSEDQPKRLRSWVGQPLWVTVHAELAYSVPLRSRMPFAGKRGGDGGGGGRPAIVRGRLRDARMLLTAARRSHDAQAEGRACYCMGVLHDEKGDFQQAVEYYRRFMVLARQLSDAKAEALAANAIGVALHRTAMSEMSRSHAADSVVSSAEAAAPTAVAIQRAVKYHAHHLQLCQAEGAVAGSYVAHSNMGLALHMAHTRGVELPIGGGGGGGLAAAGGSGAPAVAGGLTLLERAVGHQREALRLAIAPPLCSVERESLACAHLAELSLALGDDATHAGCWQVRARAGRVLCSRGQLSTARPFCPAGISAAATDCAFV